jgi:hypothetical protein
MLARVENTQTVPQLEQANRVRKLALRSGADNYGLTFITVTQNRSIIFSIILLKNKTGLCTYQITIFSVALQVDETWLK